MKKLVAGFLFSMLMTANAFAFSSARVQPARILAPTELSSFTPINKQGNDAIQAIQNHDWERHKLITLQMNLVDSIQVMARQTAKFSLTGNVLNIQSSAGDSSVDGSEFKASESIAGNYNSQNFNAPVMYSKQKTSKDGTVRIAFGVRYLHDGARNPEQGKINIAALRNEVFSLPDAMPFNDSPNLDQAVQMNQVQFVVLSWNPSRPKSLMLEGIADPTSGSESFSTTYTTPN